MPDVSIIITGRGLDQMTGECLMSLRNNTVGVDYEIVLVDNASPEPYGGVVKALADQTVRSERNLTVGAACSVGVDAASRKSTLLLFLNNDTLAFDSDWLSNLVSAHWRTGAVAVGPKQVRPDNTIFATEVGFTADRTPYHLYMGRSVNLLATMHEKPVLALNFGCILIHRGIFEKFRFDKRYKKFGHYQDIDWCLTVRKAGYQLVYTPSSEIVHLGGATALTDENVAYSATSLEENLVRFKAKWADAPAELFGLGESEK